MYLSCRQHRMPKYSLLFPRQSGICLIYLSVCHRPRYYVPLDETTQIHKKCTFCSGSQHLQYKTAGAPGRDRNPDLHFGPQNAVLFALPDKAKDRGVGFWRHYTKKLADRICPPSFPFCLMMDDSVQYWRGITLPCDPHKPFGQDAKTGDAAKHLRTDISLADMLLYFQKGMLDESWQLF
jgi:hypothetical protein